MSFSCYFLSIRAVKILFWKNTKPKDQATKKSECDGGTFPPPQTTPKSRKKPNPSTLPGLISSQSQHTHTNLLSAIIVKPRYDHPLNRRLVNLQPSTSSSFPLPARGIKEKFKARCIRPVSEARATCLPLLFFQIFKLSKAWGKL